MKWRKQWVWGDKGKLAKAAGISPQYLSDIIHGRKECRGTLAITLRDEAAKMGYKIPSSDWVFRNVEPVNPLFLKP